MDIYFADTLFYLALLDPKDPAHQSTVKFTQGNPPYHWTRLDHFWVYVTKSHAAPPGPMPADAEPDDAEGN